MKKTGRGRKRSHNPNIPKHIDQSKLPDSCYWDNSSDGHWYIMFYDADGTRKRKVLARRKARLADLHVLVDEFNGVNVGTFIWLSNKFQGTLTWRELSPATRKGYINSHNTIAKHKSKLNIPLGEVGLKHWTSHTVQKLVDALAESNGPSAANACKRYLSRLFGWGKNRGYCPSNPAAGVDQAKERKRRRLPDEQAHANLIAFAKECGALPSRTKGSCPFYLWRVLEIGYLCRLRPVESATLPENHGKIEGLKSNRRKGSRDNITEWNDRLLDAWDSSIKIRNEIWEKRKYPIPLLMSDRPLFVNTSGEPLKISTLNSAYKRLIKSAIKREIITEELVFGMHDMKRRGATDTKGTRADKQEATGHKSAAMLDVYDHSIAIVKPSSD